MTVDGETMELSLVVGEPYGELPTPAPREGWTFVGWFSGPDGTGRQITSETIVQAGDRLYGCGLAMAGCLTQRRRVRREI